MQNFLKKTLLPLLATGCMVLTATQASAQTLKVGASYAPPYYVVDANKQVSGVLADLMTSVLSKAGIDFKWKPYPTKRVYNNLISGSLNLYLGPLKTNFEGFNDNVIYSSVSPGKIALASYHKASEPGITKKEDLAGKSLAVIKGYTYGGLIAYLQDPVNNITLHEVRSFSQAANLVKTGQAQYHLDYTKSGETYLEANPNADLTPSTLFSVDLYFMMSKKTPDAEALLKKIEDAFSAL